MPCSHVQRNRPTLKVCCIFCIFYRLHLDPNIRCLEDGFIKDPSDCTVFFKCRHGRSTRMQCVEGLGFRADLRACDWKEFVESCTNEPETTTKTSVLTTRMDSPTGDSSLESQDTPANQVVPTTVAGRGNIVPAPDVSAEGRLTPDPKRVFSQNNPLFFISFAIFLR